MEKNTKKNWARIFSFQEYDVLVTKIFDESSGHPWGIKFAIQDRRPGVEISIVSWYKTEAMQNKYWNDKDIETAAEVIGGNMIDSFESIESIVK